MSTWNVESLQRKAGRGRQTGRRKTRARETEKVPKHWERHRKEKGAHEYKTTDNPDQVSVQAGIDLLSFRT